jgi:predicted dehydrogenase
MSRLKNAAFVAAIDSNIDIASSTAHKLGASISVRSFEDLMIKHSEEFDAVIINRTSSDNGPLVEKIAKAGKHVLVESPLAISTEASNAAINACKSSNVCLMVGQSDRFMPSNQKIKEILSSGKLGSIGLLRIHRWDAKESDRANQIALDSRNKQIPLIQIVRELDIANWLFEALPTELYAVGRTQSNSQMKSPDYVQVHLGFPNGGMALIDYSLTLPKGSGYSSLSVIGATGAAYSDDHHNMHLLYHGGQPLAINGGQGTAHITMQIQEFINAIEESRKPAITGSEGRDAILVAETVVQSIESGRAARLTGVSYELV